MPQEESEQKRKPRKIEVRSGPPRSSRTSSADPPLRRKNSRPGMAALPKPTPIIPAATSSSVSKSSGKATALPSESSATLAASTSRAPKASAPPIPKSSVATSTSTSSGYASGRASKKSVAPKLSMIPGKVPRQPSVPISPVSSAIDSSAPSMTSSHKSLPTYDRKKRPIYSRRTTFVDLDDFVDNQEAHGVGKCHALMLIPGQGGTFSYGPSFRDENGKVVFQHEALKVGSTKIPHLSSYGDVKFIGTVECITCMGVYFEIRGNRIFCAHLNAWMGDDPSSDGIDTGSEEYVGIKTQFIKKLQKEAKEHGWSAYMVKPETLTLITECPTALGFAIQDAIKEFLGFAERPSAKRVHGFIRVPGGRSEDNRSQVKFLGVHWERNVDPESKLKQVLVSDRVPESFEVVLWNDASNKPVVQDYIFTYGRGWHVGDEGKGTYL